ncbi:MAG: hypothetical protein ACJAZ2_000673 [Glaciecola sp.]|jgi:hypothetical protein
MINKFLKAKHWQLFVLLVGLPLVFQVVVMIITFLDAFAGNAPDLMSLGSMLVVIPVLMLVGMATFYGWFWSVGVGLQKFIPDEAKMNVKLFKVFLAFPFVYIIGIFSCVALVFTDLIDSMDLMFFMDMENPNVSLIITAVSIVLLLHLFAMFCNFYCLYFVARTVKTAELQKTVKFEEYIAEFFLLWFFAVGVWFIQPKVNEFVEDDDKSETNPSSD